MALSRYVPVVERIGSHVIYILGGYWLYRAFCARRKITVLFYHDVVDRSPLPETQLFIERHHFWEHIRCLARDYSTIPISHVVSRVPLPRCPMLLTFDGYSRGYLPLAIQLSEMGIPALFYLLTEPILTGRPYWRQQLYFVIRNLSNARIQVELDDEHVVCTLGADPRANQQVAGQLARRIDGLENKHDIVAGIARDHGVSLREYNSTYGPLTPEEVNHMSKLPGIEIGSHSHTHSDLENLDSEHLLREVVTSKRLLEQWTNKPILHYAYPSGFVSEIVMEVLRQCGYLTATTTLKKLHEPYATPEWSYSIPRFAVSNNPFYVLAGDLAGWPERFDSFLGVVRRLRAKRRER